MSGGAEMIAGAVVQRVAGMLGEAAWGRVELLWTFKDDVEDMKSKLAIVQAVMLDAENRSHGSDSESVRLWLKKLKSSAYNIEDTIDELEANTMIWRSTPCPAKLVFMSFNPLITRFTLSYKMRKVKEGLDKLVEEQRNFNFLQFVDTRQSVDINNQETSVGSSDKIYMVGRESEKRKVLNLVLQKDGQTKISIIPIVGLGGMGKTTLAESIFNAKETNMFDVKSWVHVSMEFDVKKIVASIISHIEVSFQANDATLQNLNSQIERILLGKNYLIVLDDLWEERGDKLDSLMKMLQYGKEDSKIIVTTRRDQVAAALSIIRPSEYHTVSPIKLKALSSDDCFSIMNPSLQGNGLDVDLIKIGEEIAKKCGGVPLVAKALGYVMNKHCRKESWMTLKDSNILEIKHDDYGIMSRLMLSYYHMPTHQKLCFMYCSVFPKSHNIDHDSLIQQWVALGFIQDAHGISLHLIGQECVNDFLGMSFLTLSTTPEVIDSGTFKPTLQYRMHDVVHDLARYVASEEFSFVNKMVHNNRSDNRSCHYQLLMNCNESSSYKHFPKKVRAMHFRECDKLQLHKKAFSRTLYLRVLDLSGCHVSELPISVYKLKLLRYLDASTLPISISILSKSLNHLPNLQTLIFSNTSLNILPKNIGCLQKLQYFDLSGCVGLCELPISFGNLSALLFLNLASCHELHTLPKSLGKLHRLQFFNLSDCYKLQSLPESCSQLHDLTHLDLSDCHNLEELPDWIDKLSKLEYLNMTSCSKLQILPDSLCKLMILKHLDLSFCVKLEHLPSSIGDLRVEILNLGGCVLLHDLPKSIFSTSTLKIVEAELAFEVQEEVEELREILRLQGSELDGGSGDLWTQIAQLERTLCLELKITGLEEVEHLEGAEQGKLSTNSKLTKLSLQWEHDEDSLVEHADAATAISVLAKLQPPRSLQHLDLRGYMRIDFPMWMLDISSYLPHLTTIYLINLKECNCLPPLGRLPNLRALGMSQMPNIKNVGRDFYGDYGSCQKLRIFYLESMENLEEWWTTRSSTEEGEFLIPNLHLLAASDCPKLKFLPYPPRSMVWMLENSHHVLPEHGFGNLSSSTSPFFLSMEGTFSSEGWRRTTQHLSSIEGLQLVSITGLRTLPECIRCLKSLRKLEIVLCADLETLPEWLGDLTSLREIRIDECPKLSSLPESTRGLTELKKLRIIDCPELLEKCQGEDKHKIALIPEVTSK